MITKEVDVLEFDGKAYTMECYDVTKWNDDEIKAYIRNRNNATAFMLDREGNPLWRIRPRDKDWLAVV